MSNDSCMISDVSVFAQYFADKSSLSLVYPFELDERSLLRYIADSVDRCKLNLVKSRFCEHLKAVYTELCILYIHEG